MRQKGYPYILLSILAILVIGGIFTEASGTDYRKLVPHISAQQALTLYKTGRLLLLDVHQYHKSVHRSEIVGAVYIPANKLDKMKLNLSKKLLIGVF